LAFEQGLALVPVVNKIDLPSADVAMVAAQMHAAFDVAASDCVMVSAKTGLGVEGILPAVIKWAAAGQLGGSCCLCQPTFASADLLRIGLSGPPFPAAAVAHRGAVRGRSRWAAAWLRLTPHLPTPAMQAHPAPQGQPRRAVAAAAVRCGAR
jgi:hypothetical protein